MLAALLGALVAVAVVLLGHRLAGVAGTLAATHLVAGAALLLRAAVRPTERRAWRAMGAAVLLAAGGDVAWALGGSGFPIPPASVALYLAAAPLLYGGVISLVPRRRTAHPRLWLDALICALAFTAVSAAVLDRTLDLAGRPTSARVILTLGPMVDLMVESLLLASIVVLGPRFDRRLVPLWLASLALGIGHALVLVPGRGVAGAPSLSAALLVVATTLLVVAAWTPTADQPPAPPPAWLLQLAPMVSLGLAIVIVAAAGLGHMPPAAVLTATAALVLMVVRLNLTLLDTQRATREAERLASSDSLTGLANRRAFGLGAEAMLVDAKAGGRPVALLMADLDDFKEINDSLGHAAGDEVLLTVAARLAASLADDTVVLARFSGDEFAILVDGTGRDGAAALAERIGTDVAAPLQVDGVTITPTLSIGAAVAPQDATTLALLMRRADIAMYRAKARCAGHAIYDPALGDPDGEDRLQRVAELRRAIADGEVTPHYQPTVDLLTGEVTRAEALVRWDVPGHEPRPPSVFLPLAAAAGLMPMLTAAVLDASVAQIASWRALGRDLDVAVNIASDALTEPGFAAGVLATLERHGVSAGRLALEITEDSLMREPAAAAAVLGELRRAGIQIAIDDYGQGYSSLARLRDLPVDELKLDRAFVAPIGTDPGAAAIVRSTVDLAHSLGLSIVAEGVEDVAAAELLLAFGCDAAQGFLYSPALRPADLAAWLDARTASVPAPRAAERLTPARQA